MRCTGCNGAGVQQGARMWGHSAGHQFLPLPLAEVMVTPPGGRGGLWGPYPDKVNEGVVDVGTTGQEEAAAGAELVEEEKLLLLR